MPDAPAAPTLDNVQSRSLRISWLEPLSNNREITRYYVQYVVDHRTQTVTNEYNTTNTAVLTATLFNLFPNYNYTIRVRAENAIGIGNYSQPLVVQTLEDSESFRVTLTL